MRAARGVDEPYRLIHARSKPQARKIARPHRCSADGESVSIRASPSDVTATKTNRKNWSALRSASIPALSSSRAFAEGTSRCTRNVPTPRATPGVQSSWGSASATVTVEQGTCRTGLRERPVTPSGCHAPSAGWAVRELKAVGRSLAPSSARSRCDEALRRRRPEARATLHASSPPTSRQPCSRRWRSRSRRFTRRR